MSILEYQEVYTWVIYCALQHIYTAHATTQPTTESKYDVQATPSVSPRVPAQGEGVALLPRHPLLLSEVLRSNRHRRHRHLKEEGG